MMLTWRSTPEADVLHVVTVLHQRMDLSRHLKGE